MGLGFLNRMALIKKDTYGHEMVVNGGFDYDGDWVKGTGWTISDGTANANTSGNWINIYQKIPSLVIGKTYLYSLEVKSINNGKVFLGNKYVQLGIERPGIHSFEITIGDSDVYKTIYIRGLYDFVGVVDNASVREIL